jgi:acid phosphatase
VSSIVDLLEDKGISWGAYLESMPYTGFTAEVADNKLYYRKHNPLVLPSPALFRTSYEAHRAQISYQSVAANETRMSHIKNLTMFYTDLDNDTLPQVDQPSVFIANFVVDVYISQYQQ